MFFKNLILKIRLKFFSKNSSYQRYNINFSEAKKIGVLIYNPDREENNSINQFVKELLHAGRNIEAICFNTQKNPIHYEFPCTYITHKDLDWKGDFERERVNKFIKTEFDYLYSINILPFLPFENIIRKSRAKFRIGGYEPNSDLDLMIKIDNKQTINYLLDKMVMYSKKLKSNE